MEGKEAIRLKVAYGILEFLEGEVGKAATSTNRKKALKSCMKNVGKAFKISVQDTQYKEGLSLWEVVGEHVIVDGEMKEVVFPKVVYGVLAFLQDEFNELKGLSGSADKKKALKEVIKLIEIAFDTNLVRDRHLKGCNLMMMISSPTGYNLAAYTGEEKYVKPPKATEDEKLVAEKMASLGMEAWDNENLHLAVEFLSKAIKADGNTGRYFGIRGGLYHFLNEYEKALRDCQIAVQLDPFESRVYATMSDIHRHQGRGLDGYYCILKALDLEPTNELYKAVCMGFREAMLKTEEKMEGSSKDPFAGKDYVKPNEATDEYKEAADKIKIRGDKAYDDSRFSLAVRLYTRAIELDGKNAIYFCKRAAAYLQLEDYEKACRDCEIAVQLDPCFTKAYALMGKSLAGLNRPIEARMCFVKALKLDPWNKEYLEEENSILEVMREDFDAAVKQSEGKPLFYLFSSLKSRSSAELETPFIRLFEKCPKFREKYYRWMTSGLGSLQEAFETLEIEDAEVTRTFGFL